MPLHPQAVAFLERMKIEGNQPLSGLTVPAARELDRRLTALFVGKGEPVKSVRNLKIDGATGIIPVRVYQPDRNGRNPILIYFHGGGWVLGDLDYVDSICRILTNKLNCVVVSVDYRLAPEHKFPAAADDCYAATRWIADNAAKIRGDSTRIAISGDSAGGNLAAVVALMARDKKGPSIGFQILVYPATDVSKTSRKSDQESSALTNGDMVWFVRNYLERASQGKHPYASPLRARTLRDMPPAHIITAEYDVLTKQCEAYAVRLTESGVPVKAHHFNGQLHGFFTLPGAFDASRQAVDVIVKEFSSVLG